MQKNDIFCTLKCQDAFAPFEPSVDQLRLIGLQALPQCAIVEPIRTGDECGRTSAGTKEKCEAMLERSTDSGDGVSIKVADPQRGRLRSFLLASLKNFLVNEWEKARTAKRGGVHPILSWDQQNAEGRYLAEPADGLTPDVIYEKRWAVTLLEQALARLRSEYVAGQKQQLFDTLKPYVWGEAASGGYAELAGPLGLSEGALRIAMHRLRDRYRELLRAEVASTVATPSEIDDELRHLIAVLRG